MHSYGDHASFLKFVEKNWGLPTIRGAAATTCRTRWPPPTIRMCPTNSPAIDDLTGYFNFENN